MRASLALIVIICRRSHPHPEGNVSDRWEEHGGAEEEEEEEEDLTGGLGEQDLQRVEELQAQRMAREEVFIITFIIKNNVCLW